MREFADVIEDRIKTAKLTKKDVANIAGISRPTLYAISKGRHQVKLETAIKICRALGITIDTAMGLKEQPVDKVRLRFLREKFRMEERDILHVS